jgi:hypothetical protein
MAEEAEAPTAIEPIAATGLDGGPPPADDGPGVAEPSAVTPTPDAEIPTDAPTGLQDTPVARTDPAPVAANSDDPGPTLHAPAGKRGFGELVAASLVGGVIGAAFAVGADIYWRQPPADYESRLAALETRPRPAPTPAAPQPANEALERRVVALEGQTRSLSEGVSAARSAAEASQKGVADLASRPVAAAASAPAAPPPPDPAIPQAIERLGNQLKTLEGRVAQAAPAAAIDELKAALQNGQNQAEERHRATTAAIGAVQAAQAGLNGRVQANGDEIGKLSAELGKLPPALMQAGLRSVVAGQIGQNLRAGLPLGAGLSALERLGAPGPALDPLRPYAAQPAPSAATLAAEFKPLARRSRRAAGSCRLHCGPPAEGRGQDRHRPGRRGRQRAGHPGPRRSDRIRAGSRCPARSGCGLGLPARGAEAPVGRVGRPPQRPYRGRCRRPEARRRLARGARRADPLTGSHRMWRVLLFLALLAVAAYGAVWLAENPETISFTWAGREYTTSLAVGAVAVLVLAMALSLVWAMVNAILRMPSRIGENSRRRKRERGLTALSRGIVAVGAGDVTTARRYANEAERLLGHQPLALLLKAQAAQAAGNREAAEAAFRDMREVPETRVLGLRGLFVEARRSGDLASARPTQRRRLGPHPPCPGQTTRCSRPIRPRETGRPPCAPSSGAPRSGSSIEQRPAGSGPCCTRPMPLQRRQATPTARSMRRSKRCGSHPISCRPQRSRRASCRARATCDVPPRSSRQPGARSSIPSSPRPI